MSTVDKMVSTKSLKKKTKIIQINVSLKIATVNILLFITVIFF